jgi:hypothetical protein
MPIRADRIKAHWKKVCFELQKHSFEDKQSILSEVNIFREKLCP